ncbi:MAG TPA: RHS repeat-associated core domain-containing protein [Candidatus Didemnitutus sp.]|jgi:hypothetical protein
MNGRIYDPLLGRFLSADVLVQAPGSLQSYNRYSYVMNNPLSKTDPTGYVAGVDDAAEIGAVVYFAGAAIVAVIAVEKTGDALKATVARIQAANDLREIRLHQEKLKAADVKPPAGGDKAKIENTLKNDTVTPTADNKPQSTGHPVDTLPQENEGVTAAPEQATTTGTPAPNPADSQISTGHPAPAPVVASSSNDMTGTDGVIYEVPGSGTPSGKPYIGRTTNPAGPVGRGSTDNRDRTKAKVIDTFKGTPEGRVKEQKAIDEKTLPNLDNKRNEIDPKKRQENGLPPPPSGT